LENDQGNSDKGPRGTNAYAQAVRLLHEKREIQGRLREVDKKLRELANLGTGITRLAREEIDHDV